MAKHINFTEILLKQIQASLYAAVEEYSKTIIEAAKAEIEIKLKAEVDSIAVRTLASYDIYNDKDRLVITVNKNI